MKEVEKNSKVGEMVLAQTNTPLELNITLWEYGAEDEIAKL
jgi:hypothetical protein